MNIKGTNKADQLVGTPLDDVINGGRGDDWIEGGDGNDVLTGGAGRDRFVLRAGDGHDVITDLKWQEGDRLLFDFGSYSDYMVFGPLQDGQTFRNFTGTAVFEVNAEDVNGDGRIDTVITVNSDSITILGLAPNDIPGHCLFGG